jgi:hypothetical protein
MCTLFLGEGSATGETILIVFSINTAIGNSLVVCLLWVDWQPLLF